jgi:hypothetical protein
MNQKKVKRIRKECKRYADASHTTAYLPTKEKGPTTIFMTPLSLKRLVKITKKAYKTKQIKTK